MSTNVASFLVVFNSKTHEAVYAKLLSSTIPSAKAFKDIMVKVTSEPKQGPPSPFRNSIWLYSPPSKRKKTT
jgi:hypothetical protein